MAHDNFRISKVKKVMIPFQYVVLVQLHVFQDVSRPCEKPLNRDHPLIPKPLIFN